MKNKRNTLTYQALEPEQKFTQNTLRKHFSILRCLYIEHRQPQVKDVSNLRPYWMKKHWQPEWPTLISIQVENSYHVTQPSLITPI
jgi:hypothetical protein